MRKTALALAVLPCVLGAAMTAKTTWTQRWPWNTTVDVDFTLAGGTKCDVDVSATFTTNGVPGTIDLVRAGVEGDLWELEPGIHHLEWDPAVAGLDVAALKDFAVQVTPVEDAANGSSSRSTTARGSTRRTNRPAGGTRTYTSRG